MVGGDHEGCIRRSLLLVKSVLMVAVTARILPSQLRHSAGPTAWHRLTTNCYFACILQSLPEEHRDKRRHVQGMAGADNTGGHPAADLGQRMAVLLHGLEPSACGNGMAAATHCLRSLSVLTQATQAGLGPDWLGSRLAGLTGRWVQAVLQGANSLEQQVVVSVLGESPKLGRAPSCNSGCCWRESGHRLVRPYAGDKSLRGCQQLSPTAS